MRIAPLVLLTAIVGAAAFAFFRSEQASPVGVATNAPAAPEPPVLHTSEELPPNHPPIGAGGAGERLPSGSVGPASDENPAIQWKVPDGWHTAQNPNSMRLATYHVSDTVNGAEVTVTRAGGSVEANIQRWLGQFADAGPEKRTVKRVHGVKVTVVEVSGTYLGGMSGGTPAPQRGWALLGAIVETPGSPYFFKFIGDSATVRSGRSSFDALIDSITPS